MKVGIFPFFSFLGEVKPAIELGKIIQKLGHQVVFFSHGGKYENLLKEFPLVRVHPELTPEENERIISFHINEFPIFQPLISSHKIENMVKAEVKAFEKEGIDKLISFFQFTTPLSARLSGIPLLSVVAGVWTYPGLKQNFPGKLFFISRYFPYPLHPLNQVAKKLGLKGFRNTLEVTSGDITLITDSPQIIGVNFSRMERFYPETGTEYFYIGPLLCLEEKESIPPEAERILDSSPPRILCSMGSSTSLQYLKEAYRALREMGHPAIMVIPEDKASFFPPRDNLAIISSFSPLLVEKVDLLLIHGGRNTVRWACWAGKPFLGVGMQIEQEFNLEIIRRKGMGIRLGKKAFRKEKIKKNIEKIFLSPSYQEKAGEIKKVFRESVALNQRIGKIL
ncbi:MAG: glycosyltransferase family 1 protein [Caldiserica bacterium]|nr:glycosyltransferase family 1 protein [Caldisericota bacterium]